MEMEKMIELIDAVSKSDLTGFKYEEEANQIAFEQERKYMLCDGKSVCTGECGNNFCC